MKRDMAVGFDRPCQLPIRYLKLSLQGDNITDNVGETYRNLLTEISSSDDWEYSESNTHNIEELSERFTSDLGPEAIYESTVTDGQIIIGPGSQSNLRGRLVQPLADLDLDPEDGTFAARVAEAYESISTPYVDDSEYLTPSSLARNPSDVLNLDIPFDFDSEELEEALEAAGQASREVQDLHNEIDQALTSRINE